MAFEGDNLKELQELHRKFAAVEQHIYPDFSRGRLRLHVGSYIFDHYVEWNEALDDAVVARHGVYDTEVERETPWDDPEQEGQDN